MEKQPSTHSDNHHRILIVDDELSTLNSLRRFFRSKGYAVLTAENAQQGFEIIQQNPSIQLVISDYKMPGGNGVDFLSEVAHIRPEIRRMILSAHHDSTILLAAMNMGRVHRYLVKPWNSDELMAVVDEQFLEYQKDESDRIKIREQAGKLQMLALSNRQLELLISERTAELVTRENALQEANVRLRHLTGHLEKLRDEERRAIARDIHDDLAQSLTAIQLTIATHANATTDNEQSAVLQKVKGQVNEVISTVQRILSNLRPQVLDELGLEAALDWLAKDFSRFSGIDCSLAYSQVAINIPNDVASCLYRIVQESLTNVRRHAMATRVTVSLWSDNAEIFLEIQDNGVGIMNKIAPKMGSFGIMGMQERASLCGGSCRISSSEGNGTLISVQLPLHQEEKTS